MKEKAARTWTPRLGLELPDVFLPDIRGHPTECASRMNHIWAITLEACFTPARFAEYQNNVVLSKNCSIFARAHHANLPSLAMVSPTFVIPSFQELLQVLRTRQRAAGPFRPQNLKINNFRPGGPKSPNRVKNESRRTSLDSFCLSLDSFLIIFQDFGPEGLCGSSARSWPLPCFPCCKQKKTRKSKQSQDSRVQEYKCWKPPQQSLLRISKSRTIL